MTENKRFKTGSMIQDYPVGVIMDLEHCKELIEKYGSSEDIDLMITDNGRNITYKEVTDLLNQLSEENKQLKQELFESEKEWYECHYADNPVRLDSKLEALKEEFKERFGRDFE